MNRSWGFVSLLFFWGALAAGILSAFMDSLISGILAGTAAVVSFLNLLRSFCRKCPHCSDNTCRHVIPGPIVRKIFGILDPAPYRKAESARAVIPFVLVLSFLAFYLVRRGAAMVILFCSLCLLSVLMIRIFVCPNCRNLFCPFNPDNRTRTGKSVS